MNLKRTIDREQIEIRAIRELRRSNVQGYGKLMLLAMEAETIAIDQ